MRTSEPARFRVRARKRECFAFSANPRERHLSPFNQRPDSIAATRVSGRPRCILQWASWSRASVPSLSNRPSPWLARSRSEVTTGKPKAKVDDKVEDGEEARPFVSRSENVLLFASGALCCVEERTRELGVAGRCIKHLP